MSTTHPAQSFLRWAEWTLLNTLAVAFAAFASMALLPSAAGAIGLEITDRTISLAMALLVGLFLAVAQWLLVRMHIPRPVLWIPSTFLGWIVPLIILVTLFRPSLENQQLQVATVLVSIGVLTGLTQFLLLRASRPMAPLWIVASALGWLLLAISLPIPISNNLEVIKIGAIPASITGVAFVLVVCLPGRQRADQTHAA